MTDELKLSVRLPLGLAREENYKTHFLQWFKRSESEESETPSYFLENEQSFKIFLDNSNLEEDKYKLLERFRFNPTQDEIIDSQEELKQQTYQSSAMDLSNKISELKDIIGQDSLRKLQPQQMRNIFNTIKETLSLLQINSCQIIDQKEIVRFLEKNIGITIFLREAVIEIPKIIKNKFSFRLELKEDPEINNLSTLFLFIVCRIKPNVAFKLLKKIDEYWYLKKVTDVNKFNINIEFA